MICSVEKFKKILQNLIFLTDFSYSDFSYSDFSCTSSRNSNGGFCEMGKGDKDVLYTFLAERCQKV